MSHKYEFVRIKDKLTGQEGNMWWFRATSYKEVIEHTDKIFRPFMQTGYNSASKKSIDAVFKYGDVCCMQHTTDPAEMAIRNITVANGYKELPRPMFDVANKILADAIENRLSCIDTYGECFLANGCQCFGFSNTQHEICECVFMDNLVYPSMRKATIDDVRIIQWQGGKHYYAKIGNHDVIDAKSNQKWNSEKEAKEAALWYIETENIHI